MRSLARLAVIGFAVPLAACAIHPLPEHVTGQPTYHIVQKIRCEAREALIDLALRALRESTNPRTLALADLYETQKDKDKVSIIDLFANPIYKRDVDPEVHKNFN